MPRNLLLLGLLVLAAVVVALLMRWVGRRPQVGALVFLAATAFVPVWVYLPVQPYVPPASVVAMCVALALLPAFSFRMTPGDMVVLGALALQVLSVVVGGSVGYVLGDVVFGALPAYMVGRLLSERLGERSLCGIFGLVWVVVAVLALAEAALHWNPFQAVHFSNGLYDQWAIDQIRGQMVRVEGAFGHSIALGSSLAAGIPFVARASWKPGWRLAGMTVLLGASLPTLSRTGIVCCVTAFVLSLTLLRTDIPLRARLLTLAGAVVAMLLLLPRILAVFASAGNEQERSADYRSALLVLVRELVPLGQSPVGARIQGEVMWAGFKSIDNQALLMALRFGWMPVGLLMLGLAVVLVRVVMRRGTPADIAVVAFLPAYFTVAFITQLGTVVWFVVGVGVALRARDGVGRRSRRGSRGYPQVAPAPGSGRARKGGHVQRPLTKPGAYSFFKGV
ncbi:MULTISPECIES: hypothetical protein [unclassified Actinomyces]|uniref:hypothetical protein n=1 Tax=unclassified Actinomyces TaxID=2609248 RepID=UPI0013A6F005|nr:MULTISPECIES: hypothetical protein [unclassified Actinomyces]MBW3069448.1 hypothetical protein [Actinomyces sp. 594]NDR52967.1 hypothetical protein [Actinomyces sp. 565]